MTEELFRNDSYLRECDAVVTGAAEHGITLDRTVFYPLGGGQPGDSGRITWNDRSASIVDTRYGEAGEILHVLDDDAERPAVGDAVTVSLDWDRRYRHMRMHTAMHLLGAVLSASAPAGAATVQQEAAETDDEGRSGA